MDELYSQLKTFGRVKTNALLAHHSTFRIGGPVKYMIEINNTDKLSACLSFLIEAGEEYFILGNGSNILFPDEGLNKVVIKITANKCEFLAPNKIRAESGAQLAAVVNLTAQNSLTGLEWATGIPGTVGGAVRGNAGAFGKETGSCVKSILAWRDSETVEISKVDCKFGYRSSNFKKKHNTVALSVVFEFIVGDQTEIIKEMRKYTERRFGRYPTHPSAGSFFKNVNLTDWTGDQNILLPTFIKHQEIAAGWLVEQCELKGYSVGGAKISNEHGNFLVNFNQATQADVLAVMEKIQTEVYNKFKINLEPEVEIVK